jgi:hypothetical protein
MFRFPALLIVFLLAVSSTPSWATNADFPKPPELVPRVDFWKRIYTVVDTNSGLLHDVRGDPFPVWHLQAVPRLQDAEGEGSIQVDPP